MNIRKRRKRVTLYLYNDEFNSFETINIALTRHLPDCNSLRAEQLALIAHNKGYVEICSGFSPEIYQIQANLIRCGLLVETFCKK
jgi:ATP-dependent Clp protease adapter protein ClpS